MKDRELVEQVMKQFSWKRVDVARFLTAGKATITKVLNDGQKLNPAARKLLTLKLEGRITP